MHAAATEVYVAGFVAQRDAMRAPDRQEVDEPGVHGLLSWSADLRTQLLVTDDRAYDVFAGLAADVRAGMIRVLPAARRCTELLDGDPTWTSETVTAMVCGDLRTVPVGALPGELRLRAVGRLATDAPHDVALQDAAAVAGSSAPGIAEPPEAFVDFLRSLPPTFRLFAAIEGDGTIRATSGAGVFGEHATVIFVNTEPGWRGRGIGRAMTAAALHAAQDRGARQARLDASDAGLSMYRRLGFETVARIRRFSR